MQKIEEKFLYYLFIEIYFCKENNIYLRLLNFIAGINTI